MNRFSFLALFLLIATAIADDDGRYRPGAYGDDGRYVPGDEGKYVHDGASPLKYTGSQVGRAVSPKFNAFNNQFVNRFVVDTASSNVSPFSYRPKIVPIVPIQKAARIEVNGFQNTSPIYKPQNPEASSRILRNENDVDTDSYHFAYDTENNIRAEENGRLVNKNTKNEAIAATGFFEYVGPDNVKYRVEYIADENGFQAVGAHFPTPPPIPEAIARVLVNVQ